MIRHPVCDSGYTAQTEKPLVFQRLTTELIRLWQTTGHILELPASGVSMLPLIRTGDRLTVHCTSLKALRNGDIIVYTDGKQAVVHRLIDRQRIETGWLACQKGDNLKGWTWVPETQVIGRVLGLVKADNNEWSTDHGSVAAYQSMHCTACNNWGQAAGKRSAQSLDHPTKSRAADDGDLDCTAVLAQNDDDNA